MESNQTQPDPDKVEHPSTQSGPPYPEYMYAKYTEYDPLDLSVSQDGTEIKLKTYRYACPDGISRKGVIFYIHGYGSYCEQKAYIFKIFAENGYESFALDHRGFGNSEGLKGYYGSSANIYNDLHLFIYKAIEKYQLSKTPIFLVGSSFGGLVSFNLSIKHQDTFKGMALIVPFFEAVDVDLYRFHWLIKTLNFFSSSLILTGKQKKDAEFVKKYEYIFKDPKVFHSVRVSTLTIFKQMQDFAKANFKEAKTPFLMLTVKDDVMVKNTASEEIFKLVDNPANKFEQIENSDHFTVFVEKDEVEPVVKSVISYFDQLLI